MKLFKQFRKRKEVPAPEEGLFARKCPQCGRRLTVLIPFHEQEDDEVCKCDACRITVTIPGDYHDPNVIDSCSEVDPILELRTDSVKLSGRVYGSVGEDYKVRFPQDGFRAEIKMTYLHPDQMAQMMCGADEATCEYTLYPLRTGLLWAVEEFSFRGKLQRRITHHYCVENHRPDVPYYVLERQIGEGTHGTVWAAHDLNGNPVCVKIAKPDAEYRLRQEYEVLNQLRHPSIIRPIDLYEKDGKTCLVLPYYEETAFVLKGKCNPEEVRRFCESMTSALAYLHGKGFSHNDLSLSNVLITSDHQFILTDFSCLLQGESFEDDDWRLGCATIELMTGRPYVAFTYCSDAMLEKEFTQAGIRDKELMQLVRRCFGTRPPENSGDLNDLFCDDSQIPPDSVIWTQQNGFCIVEHGNKFGLVNRFGTMVIPIEYDSLSQVGLHVLPTHNTDGFPPKMRCLYRKGDRCGSFLIDREFAVFETETLELEWRSCMSWT